ncbi:MAG: 2-oxo acid dehydrogenase subunit E2 [Firmicutes bacterium]|nr:2-oxo acid dehydrogenase subunit E2 [Bacillota bacterium]
MAVEVIMPKLGMTMEEGTILRWAKKEGDPVGEGEVLLEVQTDKVNIEVESPAGGVLKGVRYPEGAVVPVVTTIGYICKPDEEPPAPAVPAAAATEPAAGGAAPARAAAAVPATPAVIAAAPVTVINARPRATPAARAVARQHGVDLTRVAGSGPVGRILRQDVVQASRRGTGATVAQAAPMPALPEFLPGQTRTVAVTGIRKTIAQRMGESKRNAPHVTLNTEADMTEALALRDRLAAPVEKATGAKLTLTPILSLVAARTLRRHPALNAWWQGDTIIQHSDVHLGLAVALDEGLIVPVIRHADRLGLADLAAAAANLAGRARSGQLKPGEYEGGTFSITNLGMYEVRDFNPVINSPEVAILGVGAVVQKPAVVDGQIVPRPVMVLSLSFDHRAMDGHVAAAYLRDVKRALESPLLLLM